MQLWAIKFRCIYIHYIFLESRLRIEVFTKYSRICSWNFVCWERDFKNKSFSHPQIFHSPIQINAIPCIFLFFFKWWWWFFYYLLNVVILIVLNYFYYYFYNLVNFKTASKFKNITYYYLCMNLVYSLQQYTRYAETTTQGKISWQRWLAYNVYHFFITLQFFTWMFMCILVGLHVFMLAAGSGSNVMGVYSVSHDVYRVFGW